MSPSIVRHTPRLLLGAAFTLFGLNGFLQFLPQPEVPAAAGAFLGALAATGYMFPLIKGLEVLAGVALLGNRFVPLALLVLAPIMVNILAFHVALAPAGTVVPLVLTAFGLWTAWQYRRAFGPVLAARPEADGGHVVAPAAS